MVCIGELGYGNAGRNGQIPSDRSDEMYLDWLGYVRGNTYSLLYYVLTYMRRRALLLTLYIGGRLILHLVATRCSLRSRAWRCGLQRRRRTAILRLVVHQHPQVAQYMVPGGGVLHGPVGGACHCAGRQRLQDGDHKGQYYRQHHDYILHHINMPCGVCILALFIYLNNVEEGGGTHFPLHDSAAKKGQASTLCARPYF